MPEFRTIYPLMLCALILAGSVRLNPLCAADYGNGFDEEETSWKVHTVKGQPRLTLHRRNPHLFRAGQASEHLEFRSERKGTQVQMEHALPRSLVTNDLKLSLWLRSNRRGAVLGLRIVLPQQTDPRTGDVLTFFIKGDVYNKPNHWQLLQCRTLEEQIQKKLILLRAQLNISQIETAQMYVDRAVIGVPLSAGAVEFFIDEMKFGPLVDPQQQTSVVAVQSEKDKANWPVDFRSKRLIVNEQPFFPRIAPFHSQNIDVLEQTGVNLAWVPDYANTDLLKALKRRGIWAIATPPRATDSGGQPLTADDASLVPFTEETAPILSWVIGTRIAPEAMKSLVSRIEQVRRADRGFERPIMADITGRERAISRHVSMLGMSRHVLNTSFSIRQYREWLLQKRKLARPGSFVWTWIQTEPNKADSAMRNKSGKRSLVIEPEQIRLQVYAALAAGCRGIGYWKTTPFDGDSPGARERKLAVAQLNLELELLEPFLATGKLIEQIPVRREEKEPKKTMVRPAGRFRNSFTSPRKRSTSSEKPKPPKEVPFHAAVIQSELGTLLLPIWYQSDAQFVPGQMVASNVSMVVPGVPRTASAWQVTTTGIRTLRSKDVTGGIRVTLPKFDQTAAIVLSSDRNLHDKLVEKMKTIREKSARITVDLAKAKLQRVREVNQELESLGVSQPHAPQLLAQATRLTKRAEDAFQRPDFRGAYRMSGDVMQLLRIVQRSYWEMAAKRLSSPVSSPYTICFQTLPDHWRMVSRLGRSPFKFDQNRLEGGDFEEIDTLIAQGWKHEQNDIPGIRANAQLYPADHQHGYCLQLVAAPATGDDPPVVLNQDLVSVTTPQIPVKKGQIVHVSGWVRVVTPIQGSFDGAMMYDNLSGSVGALRWRKPTGWQRFEMIREVPETGPFSLKFVLNGIGEIQFDDLKIIPHAFPEKPEKNNAESPSSDKKGVSDKALEFLQNLPKLNPIPSRNE